VAQIEVPEQATDLLAHLNIAKPYFQRDGTLFSYLHANSDVCPAKNIRKKSGLPSKPGRSYERSESATACYLIFFNRIGKQADCNGRLKFDSLTGVIVATEL
jgi:hypothetical protein